MDLVADRIITVIVIAPVLLLFVHVSMLYVNNYDAKDDRVRVVVFRLFPIVTIKISNIREIEECSSWEVWKVAALKCGNRLWGNWVLIEKRRGLIRSVVITPDNAHEFVERVKDIQRASASRESSSQARL